MKTSSETLVEISDLHFAYGNRQVLKGVNLAIPRGKVVGILGVSGCGKTTLLRLIGGQLRPGRGDVKVDGKSIQALDDKGLYEARRQMGMMFQMGGLFSDMSVFDNIAFPMRELTGLPEDTVRDLVLMKLDAVGLRGARDLMPSEVSGGMARRVALARAIALDPDLIMYDEPFAGLDPISLGSASRLIRDLGQALGVTSIVVSHDVEETFAIADRIVFIANGNIVAQGTPAEIRASTDPLVHQFFTASPDGPVEFHYPAVSIADDFGTGARR